jgi:hypothetical protein
MVVRIGRVRPGRSVVVLTAVFAVVFSCLALWLGPGPARHQVTRDMAVKIAVTHLLQPDEYQRPHTEAKLVRQWQLALVSRNEVWSSDLIWLVLVPGGHFPTAGPCCSAPPKFTWNVAIVKDQASFAQLDGVIGGSQGDGPLWYRLLPDLSRGH